MKNKLPLHLILAWVNFVLNLIWISSVVLFYGISNWLFIPQVAIAIAILLFSDWVYTNQKRNS